MKVAVISPINEDVINEWLKSARENGVEVLDIRFRNNTLARNVRPKHYTWAAFYDHVIDLTRYSFSWRAIGRRLAANREASPHWMNVVRAVSSEGAGRARYYATVRRLLEADASVRRYFEGESDVLPAFYAERVRRDLVSCSTSCRRGH